MTNMRDSSLAMHYSAPEYSAIKDHMCRVDPLLADLFKRVPGNTWIKKLNKLNECNCCLKHQIRKPSELEPWVEVQPYEKQLQFTQKCKCNCRHTARFICRQVEVDECGVYWCPPCPR